MSKITGQDGALNLTAQAKRRSSLPTHPVSSKGHFRDVIKGLMVDRSGATLFNTMSRVSPETPPKHNADWNYLEADKKDHKSLDSFESLDIVANRLRLSPFLLLKETDILQDAEPWPSVSSPEDPSAKENNDAIVFSSSLDDKSGVKTSGLSTDKNVDLPKDHDDDKNDKKKEINSISLPLTTKIKGNVERLSKCLDERRLTIEIPSQEDDDIWGSHLGGLDQVEPWEDLSTDKQWVTSPLHSTKLEDLFPLFKMPAPPSGAEIQTSTELSINHLENDKKIVNEDLPSGKVPENTAITCETGLDLSSQDKKADEPSCENTTKLIIGDKFEAPEEKAETKQDLPQPAQTKATIPQEEHTRIPKRNSGAPKPKTSASTQRFHRQVSHEPCIAERNEENVAPKHRPYSLNLDLGNRCIRDISNQQNLDLADHCSLQRGAITPSGTKYDGLSLELEMFLRDRQAPMRRNSAPVSVSSVRTAFMIKTCQAKAVPVIPPKVQYSHIPHPVNMEKGGHEQDKRESEPEKIKVEKADSLPPLQAIKDCKEERENCKPVTRVQRQPSMEKPPERQAPVPEFPVLRRKRSANGDSFMDCPRPERSTLLQRSSFRNRPRPQSLILFSPPFPVMDYHPAGDDGKLVLSPIKSPAETSPLDVLTKELTENLRSPDGVTLRNKMTLPKSGQRLETSTSCFYQPQRRSMIFDNRSSRQIE